MENGEIGGLLMIWKHKQIMSNCAGQILVVS